MADTLIPMQERLEGLERQLEQRTAELLDARTDLENFNYSISHDLRAPLRHITGYGQIILEDYGKGLEPQCRKYFELIQEDALRMAGMVDDLLRLSQLGKQKPCRQPVALENLVKDVVRDISRGAGTTQVEWKIGSFPHVHCDPPMVKQVFSHLLSNALKFTRPVAQAVIEAGTINENGCDIFFVRDNGVGFDMKYADKLFSVFQRLHPPQEFEGNGVGLAMAQRIVRLHGGRIWAEASVGQGATFYFTLPEVAGL